MSGGIAQLVAVGAQDAHLVGSPEISFFRSTYKRHTNFSQTVERQVIQGNVSNNGMSTVRFERKGDLLNYVYFVPNNGLKTQAVAGLDHHDFQGRITNWWSGGLMSRTLPTLLSSPPPFRPPLHPSPSRVVSTVVQSTRASTLSASLSVRTGRLPFHSSLSNTTMWSFVSLGVLRRLITASSGISTRTTRFLTPTSVITSPLLPKT